MLGLLSMHRQEPLGSIAHSWEAGVTAVCLLHRDPVTELRSGIAPLPKAQHTRGPEVHPGWGWGAGTKREEGSFSSSCDLR